LTGLASGGFSGGHHFAGNTSRAVQTPSLGSGLHAAVTGRSAPSNVALATAQSFPYDDEPEVDRAGPPPTASAADSGIGGGGPEPEDCDLTTL